MSAPEPRAIAGVDPPDLGPPRGYSNGILVRPGRSLLFVAGQVGWDARQQLVGDGLVEQFAQALANVLLVVAEAGGSADDVVRLTLYVVDREEYVRSRGEIGRHYRQLMGKHYPAMTLVEVSALLEPGARVEIEATAAIP
jgi:enamine deaminase RidA (YjgF/YER057c/UK114 family)